MGQAKVHDAANEITLNATYNMRGAPKRPRPARVGRYELKEVLGAGAMGVVYRAHDPDLDRDVAIKVVLTGDASSKTRLLREAQAMARLDHRNVVPIFDVGPAEGAVFVVMPLLEGNTLGRWLRSSAWTFDEILDRFCAAGRGLAAAHAAGLVHRDFKPENVLLGTGGETQVSDFGLACLILNETTPSTSASMLAWAEITQTGDILGTPAYMAPEQLRGRPSGARADQFSFCIALWEGIYGERAFAGQKSDTGDPIHARLEAIAAGPVPPAPRRGCPAWILPVLARGLEVDPDRRWPTMDALLDAIAAGRAPRRWRWRLAVGAAIAAIVLAIAVAVRPSPPAPRSQPVPPPPPSLVRIHPGHLANADRAASDPAIQPAVPIIHRGHLANAAISPDGQKLAIVAGDSLVLRRIAARAEDDVLVEHGMAARSISWSPDGGHLLVNAVPEVVDVIETQVVDVSDGAHYKLPAIGLSAFLSSGEVAVVTSYRERSVKIFPLGEHATEVATCRVPGDYTFIERLAGMSDGTMILETSTGKTHGLVILDRDCSVRATFSAEPISGVALSDTATVVTLVRGDGFGDILELSLRGEVISRRRVSGDLEQVIGRRHGTDYVLALAPQTHLARVHPDPLHPNASSTRVFTVNGSASFSIAPDGGTLGWIELGGPFRLRGPLRLSAPQDLRQSDHPLLDNAVSVGWSPDGRLLAALVDDDRGGAIVVVDRAGHTTQRWGLPHLDLTAQPVWLDDHRIAGQTDDLTTYRWFDLETGEQGDLTDRAHGSTYWLTRSPRDGTLAMWRIGKPGAINAQTEHLWLMSPGHEAAPLHVDDATKHHLLPSWSPSGELLVRALETGVVSRVDRPTGKLTPIAQLPAMSLRSNANFEHLLTLPDDDLLAVETDPGRTVSIVRPDNKRAQPAAAAGDPL